MGVSGRGGSDVGYRARSSDEEEFNGAAEKDVVMQVLGDVEMVQAGPRRGGSAG